jgi:hypothetical protein
MNPVHVTPAPMCATEESLCVKAGAIFQKLAQMWRVTTSIRATPIFIGDTLNP